MRSSTALVLVVCAALMLAHVGDARKKKRSRKGKGDAWKETPYGEKLLAWEPDLGDESTGWRLVKEKVPKLKAAKLEFKREDEEQGIKVKSTYTVSA